METMDWFKKHADTCIILGAFAVSILWMNGKFSDVDNRFNTMELEIDHRFSAMETNIDHRFSKIEKEIAVMKTVLLMKDILPKELVKNNEQKTKD